MLVRLKWGETEYKGTLVSVDSYMNIQLNNTEEFVDGKSTGSLGQVMIRLVTRLNAPRLETLSSLPGTDLGSTDVTMFYGFQERKRRTRMSRWRVS